MNTFTCIIQLFIWLAHRPIPDDELGAPPAWSSELLVTRSALFLERGMVNIVGRFGAAYTVYYCEKRRPGKRQKEAPPPGIEPGP